VNANVCKSKHSVIDQAIGSQHRPPKMMYSVSDGEQLHYIHSLIIALVVKKILR